MFGHLKPKDFASRIENGELSARRTAHLGSCSRCTATLMALESIQADMSSAHEEIPEPDWAEFRSGVRDAMLSRSIRRNNTAVRRWTGWSAEPAMVWSLSAVFVSGLMAGALLWNQHAEQPVTPPIPQTPIIAEAPAAETEVTAWSQTDVFDDLARLKDNEVQNLQKLLEHSVEGPATR
jgi:hypothetical protein